MYIIKKAYNLYRNLRSKYLINLNKFIYGNKFLFGKGLYVQKGFVVTIEESGNILLGENVFFNNFCSLNSLNKLQIGNDCIFGENVKIYDHNHIYIDPAIPVNYQGFKLGEVHIGNNCWIGSNVVILKDVHIGDNCVIGANCVIFKNVPDNCIVKNNQDLIITNIERGLL